MKSTTTRNSLLLLLAAIIWGVAFVFQSVGADHLGAFAFNALRYPLGSLVLIPIILIKKKKNTLMTPAYKGAGIKGGIACGLCLFAASAFQQLAMSDTSSGKAGFITAFYIVLVPVFGIFLKKKTSFAVWIAVVLAIIGLFCLCMKGSFSIAPSDASLLACAAIFACHILVIDHYSPMADGVVLSCVQFATAAVLSFIFMLVLEGIPAAADIQAAGIALLYTGIMSCGVAYTLQIIGQNNMNPAAASIILSLESCVSVIAGMIMLGQMLDTWEIVGCIFMFVAVLITQLRRD